MKNEQYNQSQRKICTVQKGRNNYIIASAIYEVDPATKDEELKAVDIRNWYKKDENLGLADDNLAPTQKGVRIPINNLSEIIGSILTRLPDEIADKVADRVGYYTRYASEVETWAQIED